MRKFWVVLAMCVGFVAGVVAAADRIEIVSELELGRYWQPAPDQPRIVAGYPDAAIDRSQDVCVSIGYLIGTDGRTSRFTQLSAWSSAADEERLTDKKIEPFVQISAAVVSRQQYVRAGDSTPQPVFTSATFGFDGSKTQGSEAIRQRCAIANLQAFVDEARRWDPASSMRRSNFERFSAPSFNCSAQSSFCALSRESR